MSLTLLHTADWQLGKPFGSLQDEAKRHRLQDQRLRTVRAMATIIDQTQASLLLVAGDLFDSPHVTKATISSACAAIGSLRIPVFVIPGNHDHGGPDSLWEQEFFQREKQELAPNLHVLLNPKPVILDSAILFPAPLLRRHEPGDPTAWIRQALHDPSLPDDRPRIVLAHGTIQGFGSVQEEEDGLPSVANWIDLSSLPIEAIDYIALGDWHGTKKINAKTWYSGTPETDRFPKGEANDPGHVLRVTLTRGQLPVVEKIPSTTCQWKQIAFRFSDDASLDLLSARLDTMVATRGDQHLILLSLEGTLGLEAAARLESLLETWKERLVRLKLDQRVTIAPSEDEVAALTRRTEDPLISSVATQLVAKIHGDTEEAAIARLALRELHAAMA